MSEKIALFGLMPSECEALMMALGEPAFRGRQLVSWLYEKKIDTLDECRNIPKKILYQLAEIYDIGHGEIIREQLDPDDETSKFLIRFADGACVETVLMSYDYGYSVCVSSQVGCAMGCDFCASTKDGLQRNLTAGEILDQVFCCEKIRGIRVSNVVVMGMGEPLQNYEELLKFIALAGVYGIGARKITVSTCGIVPKIYDLAREKLQINLAVSLHSAIQDRREQIMPIARRYNLNELIKSCKFYFEETGRRISFEYALMADFNDRQADIDALSTIFAGQNVHVNLIGLNPIPGAIYKNSKNVNFFCEALKKRGINCTIRRRMGGGIDAACGQLRRSEQFTMRNA